MREKTHIDIKTAGGPYVQQNSGWVLGAGSHVTTTPVNPKPVEEEKRGKVPEHLRTWLAAIAAFVGLVAALARAVGWM